MNRCVSLVVGDLGKHLQLLGLEILFRGGFNDGILAVEEAIEPAQHRQLQILRVLVRAFGDEQAEVRACAVKSIDLTDMTVQSDDAVERKDAVFVGVADQQRPRREHCRQLRIIPGGLGAVAP